MKLLKNTAAAGVFLFAIFLMVELSYRVYVVGPMAFEWRKINSMTTLMRSEFVQLAENPEVFFELQPGMTGWFKGQPFATNSSGQADKEYDQPKPQDVFRVAVVGSSWTMPTGVPLADAWHSVLEEDLSAERSAGPVEFINFGVELYGLGEILGTLKYKVPEWQPDLVLVAITTYTTSFVWEEPSQSRQLPPRAYPALQSFAFGGLGQRLGLWGDGPGNDRPRFADGVVEPRLAQVQRALRELSVWQQATKVPVAVVFLGFWPMDSEHEALIDALAAELSLELIHANRLFLDVPNRQDYQVSQFDRHPNKAGHRLIADFVASELAERNMLPETAVADVEIAGQAD